MPNGNGGLIGVRTTGDALSGSGIWSLTDVLLAPIVLPSV